MIRLTLLWCSAAGTYLIGWAPDDRLRESAFLAISGLAASVVCGYLGFASWDDRNVMRHLRPPGDGPCKEPDTL